MGLHDKLQELTGRAFLNTSYFGEEVTFYKGDRSAEPVKTIVVWDADQLTGTNEIDGDGVVMERASGRRVRDSFSIECSSSLNIDERSREPDYFVRTRSDGIQETAIVKRIIARDEGGMMLVRCIKVQDVNIRGLRRMG